MKIVHIVVGAENAVAINRAYNTEQEIFEEILTLDDSLDLGPLKVEGEGFAITRQTFNQQLILDGGEIEITDLDKLMKLSTRMKEDLDIQVWYWLDNTAATVCGYYWLLQFMKQHIGRIAVVNIAGLPFFDMESKLFFPDTVEPIPANQLLKARKLMRELTIAEWEMDIDEWKKLVVENGGVRILEGGKKIKTVQNNIFDEMIIASCNTNFQKITKFMTVFKKKNKLKVADRFIIWRLAILASMHKITSSKDSVKALEATTAGTLF